MTIMAGVVRVIAGMVLCLMASGVCAQADSRSQQTSGGANLSAAQLDQMLAPIALYPDTLLAQILMAATYPLEIVQADRWLQVPGNASLTGAELDAALRQHPWDPSVKSLVPFPQILKMMDDNLNWTEQLGDAFLADRAAVMDSVQRLRVKAQVAGTLQTTHYQTVSSRDSVIVINSAPSDIVYVPVYDPFVVYGPWPYPAFPPYYFPGYFGVVVAGGPGFGWFGFSINIPLWGWSRWDWPRRRLDVDHRRFNEITVRPRPIESDEWHHDPFHRHGVPYRDDRTRERFQPGGRSPDARRFRGYPVGEPPQPRPGIVQPLPEVVRPLPQVVKPLPQVVQPLPPRAQPMPQPQPREERTVPRSSAARQFDQARPPPAFESFGRGQDIRIQSERGFSSRHSAPMTRGDGGGGQRGMPRGQGASRPNRDLQPQRGR